MDEKIRYKFKKTEDAAKIDKMIFEAFREIRISKANAIRQISHNTGVEMSEKQFNYYYKNLGWAADD